MILVEFLFCISQKEVPLSQDVTVDEAKVLDASLSFGYGLIQVAISIVPAALLKVCELFGFQGDREVGLDALKVASQSDDMKAPIARYEFDNMGVNSKTYLRGLLIRFIPSP